MSFLLPKPAATPPPPGPSALPAPLSSPPSYASGSSKPSGANPYRAMGGTLLTSPIGPDSTFGSTNSTTQKSLLGQ